MPAEGSEGTSTQALQPPPPEDVSLPLPPPVSEVVPVPSPPPADDASNAVPRCANCLTILAGPYCAQCGQHVADYHRSVWRFVADFFDNTFCWDNKLFRTLGPLFKQPGWLTQEFMAGRRVRYVHPLRLFLFTSAVCLTLLQFNHAFAPTRHRANKKETRPAVPVQLDTENDEDEDDRKPAAPPSPAASVSPVPAATPVASTAPTSSPPVDSFGQILRDTVAAGLKGDQGKNAKTDEEIARRWETFGDNMEKHADAVKSINQTVATNIQQKASWVALAMLPIFAWLMYFCYGRRGGFFFAYLVFSLHYHTFLLLFWTAYLWLSTLVQATHLALLEVPLVFGFLGPPWYLYLSLRRFYGEGRSRTAAKAFAIGGMHLLAIIIGVAIAGVGSSLLFR